MAASIRARVLPEVDPLKLLYAVQGLASYPFLVPAQVKHLSGTKASSREFASAYADVVLALLFRGSGESTSRRAPATGAGT